MLCCCACRVHQPVRQCLGWLLLHAGQFNDAWRVYSQVSSKPQAVQNMDGHRATHRQHMPDTVHRHWSRLCWHYPWCSCFCSRDHPMQCQPLRVLPMSLSAAVKMVAGAAWCLRTCRCHVRVGECSSDWVLQDRSWQTLLGASLVSLSRVCCCVFRTCGTTPTMAGRCWGSSRWQRPGGRVQQKQQHCSKQRGQMQKLI